MNAQADIWARTLMADGMLPAKARVDALHLSLATAYQIDFLLTWNCRHLANAHLMRQLHRWFEEHAGRMPLICTPDQLLERFPHG